MKSDDCPNVVVGEIAASWNGGAEIRNSRSVFRAIADAISPHSIPPIPSASRISAASSESSNLPSVICKIETPSSLPPRMMPVVDQAATSSFTRSKFLWQARSACSNSRNPVRSEPGPSSAGNRSSHSRTKVFARTRARNGFASGTRSRKGRGIPVSVKSRSESSRPKDRA